MWPGRVDRLSDQHPSGLRVARWHRIVGQMHVEVEVGDSVEPPARVQVPIRRERGDPVRSRKGCGTETIPVLDGDPQPFHQTARVPSEALLPRYQRIAAMKVLHVALLQITRGAYVTVWSEDHACSFAGEKLPQRLSLVPSRFLFRDHVIQAEYEQRIRVGQDAVVERKSASRLIHALIHSDRMPGNVGNDVLERYPGEKEQLE